MIERAVALWKASQSEKGSAADVAATLSLEFAAHISRNALIARMLRSGHSYSGPPVNNNVRLAAPVSVLG
jgi:hypothetical protein